jgi:hypothetical protein
LELHALADERDLVLGVGGVREAELQQVLLDERARRPREHVDALEASARIGDDDVAALPARRRPEAHAREGPGVDPQ